MSVQTVADPVEELIQQAKRVLPGGSFGNMPAEVILREGKAARSWDESTAFRATGRNCWPASA